MAYFSLPLAITIMFVSLTITIAVDDTLVLDVYGNPLELGTPYYQRDELSKVGMVGGLVTASKPNQGKCPQYVGLLSLGWYQESPIIFYSTDPSQKYVHVSSNLVIVSNSSSSACPQGAWKVSTDADSGNVFISTDGDVGNPTMENLFKIEKPEYRPDIPYAYQMNYCPTGGANNIMCGKLDVVDLTEDFSLGWYGVLPYLDGYSTRLSFIKA